MEDGRWQGFVSWDALKTWFIVALSIPLSSFWGMCVGLHVTVVTFLPLDDEEALNSIMKDLAALGRCYTSHTSHTSHKPKTRTLSYKQVRSASSICPVSTRSSNSDGRNRFVAQLWSYNVLQLMKKKQLPTSLLFQNVWHNLCKRSSFAWVWK